MKKGKHRKKCREGCVYSARLVSHTATQVSPSNDWRNGPDGERVLPALPARSLSSWDSFALDHVNCHPEKEVFIIYSRGVRTSTVEEFQKIHLWLQRRNVPWGLSRQRKLWSTINDTAWSVHIEHLWSSIPPDSSCRDVRHPCRRCNFDQSRCFRIDSAESIS